jgi:N-acetylglucosamine-6-phosphate deacetylase
VTTAITADVLFTPLQRVENPVMLLDGGVVRRLGTRAEIELPADAAHRHFAGGILAPGLVDVHIHGAAGHDVMEDSPAGLAAMEHMLARHGVTSYVPTTITAPLEATLAALQRLGRTVRERAGGTEARARPVGIHLEGPFIAHARCGAHAPEHLLQPSFAVFDRLCQAAEGAVRLLTIAPELPGAPELIGHAVKKGVRVSLGHSDATLEQARAGVAAGAVHATHTFNAMRPLGHRDPGIVAAALGDDRLTADIICDGIHVDPAVVALFLRLKGEERALLITDAISATGMPDGRYRLGGMEVEVANGRCLRGHVLAGSVLTLDRAVRNVMQFAGWGAQQALRLATRNPAKLLGMHSHKGVLAPGADADLIVLSPTGEVVETFLAGRAISS